MSESGHSADEPNPYDRPAASQERRRPSAVTVGLAIAGFVGVFGILGSANDSPSTGGDTYYAGVTCSDWEQQQVGVGASIHDLSKAIVAANTTLSAENQDAVEVLVLDYSSNLKSFDTGPQGTIPLATEKFVDLPGTCKS